MVCGKNNNRARRKTTAMVKTGNRMVVRQKMEQREKIVHGYNVCAYGSAGVFARENRTSTTNASDAPIPSSPHVGMQRLSVEVLVWCSEM